MSLSTVIFCTLIGVAAVAAGALLFVKEVFNAAILLLVSLLAIAGIFVFLNAEFLAIVQIMVYAGGILLLIVFGVMLTSRIKAPHADNRSVLFYVSVSMGIALTSLLWLTLQVPAQPREIIPVSPGTVGMELVTSFGAAFEVAGILLLISLVAAMTIASYRKFEKHG